jgi:hypothetical protein
VAGVVGSAGARRWTGWDGRAARLLDHHPAAPPLTPPQCARLCHPWLASGRAPGLPSCPGHVVHRATMTAATLPAGRTGGQPRPRQQGSVSPPPFPIPSDHLSKVNGLLRRRAPSRGGDLAPTGTRGTPSKAPAAPRRAKTDWRGGMTWNGGRRGAPEAGSQWLRATPRPGDPHGGRAGGRCRLGRRAAARQALRTRRPAAAMPPLPPPESALLTPGTASARSRGPAARRGA